jgi:hypothetical protein
MKSVFVISLLHYTLALSFLGNSSDSPPVGMQLISQFLLEDNSILDQNGGVVDRTGIEGLSLSEKPAPIGTAERLKQRARSAASLYLKKHGNESFEAVGAIEDSEVYDGWKVWNVMVMNGKDYQVVKVCLPATEQMMALVIDQNDNCGPKVRFK